MRRPHRRSRQRGGDGLSGRWPEHAAQHEPRPRDLHREGRRGEVRDARRRVRGRPPDAPRAPRTSHSGTHDRTATPRAARRLMRSRATLAWGSYVLIAGALAAYAVIAWLAALIARAPVLYGEGAVANAARLARAGVAYLDVDPQRFVAANYPPLYLHVASIGDAFVTGRIVGLLGTLAVAPWGFLSAQPAGPLPAAPLRAGRASPSPAVGGGGGGG